MIAYLYRLPGWFLSPDDKPTYQVFQAVITAAENLKIECKTIDTPTLSTISVQSTISTSSFNTFDSFQAFNYIKYNSNWYQITEVTYVSDNQQVVEINGTLDLYLTWVVPMFNEQGTLLDDTIVYFNQKHLNRFIYNTNLSTTNPPKMVLYQHQFYLLNKHPTLANVGTKLLKNYYTTNNYTYANNGLTAQSNYYPGNSIASVNPNLAAYVYCLWKLNVNETNVPSPTIYPVPGALGSVNNSTGPLWWQFIQQQSWQDYYTGIYTLPLPINNWIQLTNNQVATISVPDVTGNNVTGNYNGYNSTNWACIALTVNQLFANATAFNGTYAVDGSVDEPAILNWCHGNVRMYGQDNTVDVTSFNYYVTNINSTINPATTIINQLYLYLGSFMLTISPPNMMLTNIPISLYSIYYNNSAALGTAWISSWNYNALNDAIFSIILKNELPSLTTAWGNYIDNNKNNYSMALNVTNLQCQNAQASIKMANANYGGSVASYDNVAADLLSIFKGSFGSQVASTYNASIEANTIAPNDANIQQDKLNYLQTGMKADYSRVSNMRVSAQDCPNSLYDTTYTWVYEYLPLYEQYVIINYYALNGYLLERWDKWGNWNNRVICNYVKCTNWCNAIGTYIPLVYRSGVDHLFNVGFRVWDQNGFTNGYEAVPYNTVLANAIDAGDFVYNNFERNNNNDEVCFLTNTTNDTLLSGAPTNAN